MRRAWIAGALGVAAMAACEATRSGAQRAAPQPAAAASTALRAPSRTAATSAVERCATFSSPLVARSCALQRDGGSGDIVSCTDFAATAAPRLELLTLVVYRGREQFASILGIPSMLDVAEAGSPLHALYRSFEGPELHRIPDGRRVKIEARGIFLGGAIRWGSLASPHDIFDTVLAVHDYAGDYPVSPGDRKAIKRLDIVTVLQCVDKALWP